MTQKECKSLAEYLLLDIEDRGRRATGVYSKGYITKANTNASDFMKRQWLPKEYGKITLLHCRAPTQGTPKDNHNNHPIYSKKWVMVHNGHLDMDRLANYNYFGEVDSEILLSYIEVMGLEKALTQVRGSAAIALVRPLGRCIYLWRNNNPIKLGYMKDKALIFASTTDAIFKSVNKTFGIINKFPQVHVIGCADDMLVRLNHDGKVTYIKELVAKPEPRKTKATKMYNYRTMTGKRVQKQDWSPKNSKGDQPFMDDNQDWKFDKENNSWSLRLGNNKTIVTNNNPNHPGWPYGHEPPDNRTLDYFDPERVGAM